LQDVLADLNDSQRAAVKHLDGPLLVLAGAGSGKTRVITRRVAHLIARGVPPEAILAITFTNKAAEEMRHRVAALGCPQGATVCTFHSLCARLLREHAAAAGLPANYSIYDRDDQLKLVKQALEDVGSPFGLQPAAVHAAISRAKNGLTTAADFAAETDDARLAEAYRRYEALLAANAALDFDDLLLRVALLFRDRPEIRAALSGRYRYVLVDEYQDTNRAQYVVAHGIAMDHRNLCVTGDPDQSIYAWRGADVGNILEFETDYPDAVVVRLEENYRSSPAILAAAGRLIARNRLRKPKALWTRRGGGPDVRVVLCDDERAEAAAVADRIAAEHDAGGGWGGVAVFYRVNWLSRLIEETLFLRGIPFVMARGTEFYNRKEVKDVIAYLRLLVNGDDGVSCERVINVPARGIGAATVRRLRELAGRRGQSLLWACRHGAEAGLSAAAAKKAGAFALMIDSLAARLDSPVREVVQHVLDVTGLAEAADGGEEAGGNINELLNAAAQFDASCGGTLAEYLERVSLVSDVDHLVGRGQGRGAVTLMTLHAAKGLEFPRVFIVGCEQGLLPFARPDTDRREADSPQRLEEERRLAFVGMTRAQNELTLTCARRRMVRGQTVSQSASQFLSELAGEGVTVEDLTTAEDAPRRHAARARRGGFYEDEEVRAAIEAAEMHPPADPEHQYLRPGCRVHHPAFGTGTVTRIGTQPWPETRVDVHFAELGPKRFKLSQTPLEVLAGEEP